MCKPKRFLFEIQPRDLKHVCIKLPYSAKPILSQELPLFVVAAHIKSSGALVAMSGRLC